MELTQVYRQLLLVLLMMALGDHVSVGGWAMGSRHHSRPSNIRVICADSEIEILSRQGVRIEPYERSRVEMPLVENPPFRPLSKFQLKFYFKTTSPNGTLFYGRNPHHPNELIAMVLINGDLIYKAQCPTMHVETLIPTKDNSALDDGEWHEINYSIKYRSMGNKGRIRIDGYSNSKSYEVSCSNITKLVMGGISPADHGYVWPLENIKGHFEGCIKNVLFTPPMSSPPKYFAVSGCI